MGQCLRKRQKSVEFSISDSASGTYTRNSMTSSEGGSNKEPQLSEIDRILAFDPNHNEHFLDLAKNVHNLRVATCNSFHFTRKLSVILDSSKSKVHSDTHAYTPPYDASVDPSELKHASEDHHSELAVHHHHYRTHLPVHAEQGSLSFRSMAKNFLGKDLSKITMPVQICEPLTWLQRLAECNLTYCDVIGKASTAESAVSRMEYVCAFVVSSMSVAYKRMNKPFNPMLGETYEHVRPDLCFRFVAEQVSLQPPVSAFHAEGRGFSIWGTLQPRIKFTGRTVESTPLGSVNVHLKKYKETYSTKYAESYVRNIIFGKMWIENKGELEVHCHDNNTKGVLKLKPCDWSGDHHHVEGFVYEGHEVKSALYGSWVKGMHSCSLAEYEYFLADKTRKAAYIAKAKRHRRKSTMESKTLKSPSVVSFNLQLPSHKLLWRWSPRHVESLHYFMMPRFAMSLNELLPDHVTILPATDSRLREDIRLLENGKMEEAGEEKARLEDRQRTDIMTATAAGVEHVPKWFVAVGAEDDQVWEFTHSYWDRQWDRCPQRSGSVVQVMCQALSTFQILSGTVSLVNTEL